MATGNIVDSSAMDTFSENPTATYVVQAHGGTNKTYNSVCYGTAPITGVDPLSVPTVVAGAMKAPPAPPVPPEPTNTCTSIICSNQVPSNRKAYCSDICRKRAYRQRQKGLL